jgi:arylsulfatase A-like enzyme
MPRLTTPPILRTLIASTVTLVASAVALAAPAPAPTPAAAKPNIVFLLADDLGSHDVSWRGSEIKTPNLDKLAKAGTRLEQFYVQPVCSPTRAALLTGRYPFRHGLQTGVVRPWAEYGLPLEERTLPKALKEAGYETAIVGKWHLGHFRPEYLPTRRGFDHQYGHYNGALDYFTHVRDGGFDWHRDDKENRDEGYSTELVGREAARLVRERDKAKPLFLYVPFNGVHAPYQVPDRYAEAYGQFQGKRRTYAGMVTAVDDAVGVVVKAIEDQGLTGNTLFVFSSDNGGPQPGKITSNGPFRAGKGTLYEGGVRTCAFATWPGHVRPGAAADAPLHMVDWYPTLLKLAGASAEQPLPVDGRDLWPALTAGAPSPHELIVLNAAPNAGAVRAGDWKLVLNGTDRGAEDDDGDAAPAAATRPARRAGKAAGAEPAAGADRVELFNLATDPREKSDLSAKEPAVVQGLREQYDAVAKEAVAPKGRPKAKGFKSPAVWGQADAGTPAGGLPEPK